jgi:hypothetical protein
MVAVAAVALEDGGSAATLGGGFRRWLKTEAAALGSGCGRRTWDDDIGIYSIKAKGYYHNVGISLSKDGKRGCV